METSVAAAAEAVKTLAKQYRAVLLVGEVLENLVSLEQRKAELERAIKTAKKEAAEADLAVITVRDELSAQKSKAARVKAVSDEKVRDAKAQAETLVAVAVQEADRHVANARYEVAAVHDQLEHDRVAHNVAMSQKQAEYDALSVKVDDLKIALAELKVRVNV